MTFKMVLNKIMIVDKNNRNFDLAFLTEFEGFELGFERYQALLT